MALFNFEGEVKNITERQLEYISSVLEQRGIKKNKVLVENVGKAGDNYAANVKRIIVTTESGEEFKMIAKIAPSVDMLRMMSGTADVFRNEHVMYTEILPKFVELQKSVGVPEAERLRFAECYGSYIEAPNEVILLEDLQVSNFIMLDRFKPLSEEALKLFLKNLAIYHSLSYVVKNIEPETYESFKSKIVDIWSAERTAQMQMLFSVLEQEAMIIIDGEEYKKIVSKTLQELPIEISKLAKADFGSKHFVMIQGDSWTNNIMFKLDGDKPVEAVMIDYQQSKESNPASDLHYMILSCTDHESRKKHFNDWMAYYHTELDKNLAHFGLKANMIYPKDQLDVDLKRYAKVQLGLAIIFSGVLIRKSEDASKIKDAFETFNMEQLFDSFKISNLDDESIGLFKKRIVGLIDSFKEFGYL